MPTQHAMNTIQPEQAMRERSLAGLVTFYKKLPQRHTPDRPTWLESCMIVGREILVFIFRDLVLRVMLKIVRLSLQDRPPPNTNHLYIENTIKVSPAPIPSSRIPIFRHCFSSSNLHRYTSVSNYGII